MLLLLSARVLPHASVLVLTAHHFDRMTAFKRRTSPPSWMLTWSGGVIPQTGGSLRSRLSSRMQGRCQPDSPWTWIRSKRSLNLPPLCSMKPINPPPLLSVKPRLPPPSPSTGGENRGRCLYPWLPLVLPSPLMHPQSPFSESWCVSWCPFYCLSFSLSLCHAPSHVMCLVLSPGFCSSGVLWLVFLVCFSLCFSCFR